MKELPESRSEAIQAFKDLQDENADLKKRVQQLESSQGGHADVSALKSEIADLKKEIKTFKGSKEGGENRDEKGWLIDQ